MIRHLYRIWAAWNRGHDLVALALVDQLHDAIFRHDMRFKDTP